MKYISFTIFLLLFNTLVFANGQRIISLAPNITEILFAIGAGNEIIGTSAYSNYPKEAKLIPIVANSGQLNFEKIIALKPSVILGWKGGNSPVQLAALQKIQVPIYQLSFNTIQDITKNMKKLGEITGNEKGAALAIKEFERKLKKAKSITKTTVHKAVSVFYIIWQHPLMTIGKNTLINQAIEFCGGQNIFGTINEPAPQISIASVIVKNPDIIISGIQQKNWENFWMKWSQISAIRMHQLYYINPDLLQRAGPRFADGLNQLCEDIHAASLTKNSKN